MSVNNVSHDQINFLAVNVGDTADLVAAITDKKIRVISYVLVATGDVGVNFESSTTDITGVMPLSANGGVSYAGSPAAPAFETAAGEKLAITLSTAESVDGHLAYIVI